MRMLFTATNDFTVKTENVGFTVDACTAENIVVELTKVFCEKGEDGEMLEVVFFNGVSLVLLYRNAFAHQEINIAGVVRILGL